jgi:ribosome-associated translation inhibitor RaiA
MKSPAAGRPLTAKERMQVLLHSDPHTDGSQAMAGHLQTVVNAGLGRFGERITRVEAHLSDADGAAKAGAESIHCTLQAQLVGQDAVVVKDSAGNAHQAIEGALRKLKRAVGAALGKHDPRHHHARDATLAQALVEDPEA